MRVQEHQDGVVETWHRPLALPLVLAALGLAALLGFVVSLARGPLAASVLSGLFAVLCLWGAWVQRSPSRFLFDPSRQMVHWRSAPGVFGRAGGGSGGCRFEDVRQVVLQPGPGKYPDSARLALLLADGLRPLARDFDLGRSEASALAERLRALIGLPGAREVTDRVLAAARANGDEAAIAMLREHEGLSRDQACELLKHLKES